MLMAGISTNVTIDDLVIDHLALYESMRKSFKRDPFDHYVHGICTLSICLLGVVSNAFSFSILIRRTMRLSTYVYLAGLCLSDFTACLFLIPSSILAAYPVEVPDFELPRTYTYTRILIIAGAISTTARALSIWLCMAFTIDRWIMICRPFAGPLYCTIKNARFVATLLCILSVLYAVPLTFEFDVYENQSVSRILQVNYQRKIYHQTLSEIGKSPTFRWIYASINALLVYLIPLTTIAILNRQLFLSIRQLEQRSQEYNAPLPTKQGVTAMLLATTINLIVFRLPSAIISIMWLISAKIFINDKAPFRWRKFHSVANVCATFNAATTFIFFIIYGTKFRSEFTRIYCCALSRLRKRSSHSSRVQEEYQPMQQRFSNGFSVDKHLSIGNGHGLKNKSTLSAATNGLQNNTYLNVFQTNHSTATCTTAPSSVSLLPKNSVNLQRDTNEQLTCPLTSDTNQAQISFVNGTDSYPNEPNSKKSMLIAESYYTWLKKLAVFRSK